MPADPELAAIGEALRSARIAAGRTQADLARAAETHQSTISLIERGLAPLAAIPRVRRLYREVGLPDPIEPDAQECELETAS